MIGELEARLRESLRRTVLPPAPDRLRRYLSTLPHEAPLTTPVRERGRPTLLLGVAAVVALGLTFGAILLAGSDPTVAPTEPPPDPPSDGITFEAPGIAFRYPADWTDQTDIVDYPPGPSSRFVALLVRGFAYCPPASTSSPAPTPAPGTCQTRATTPGSLWLSVTAYPNQLPGALSSNYPWSGTPTTIAGYPAWEWPDAVDQSGGGLRRWMIQAPDGGLYHVMFEAPRAELDDRTADVQGMLETLTLSPWSPPREIVNGRARFELPNAFSFEYPAEWTVYYPLSALTPGSSMVVMVSSRPVEPRCADDLCQRFTTPPGTVAIEFGAGGGPMAPDWSNAPTSLAGQPATREDWGPVNATDAEEGHTWSVRLTDRSSLTIFVSMSGPGLSELRGAMEEVLDSIEITADESAAP
jgi:hypothetical protein